MTMTIRKNEIKEAKYQWIVTYTVEGRMTSPICEGNHVIGWNHEVIEINKGFETKEQAEKYVELLKIDKESAGKFYEETRVPVVEVNPYDLFADLK